MGGITKVLLLLVTVLNYDTGFGFKLSKVSERIDDLELKVLTERIERRKSLRNIEHSLENIEGRLNISLAQEGPSGDEIQQMERRLNEIKELLGATKLAEISETFHLLKKGFNAEKKQSLKFRRRVSHIEEVLTLLSNNSDTLTRIMFAYFEDSRQRNEDLRKTNKDMKEMYENTSNALLHVSDALDSMTTKMVNVVSTALETTINETMAKYSLEFRQELKKISCQVFRSKTCLELLKYGCTQSGVYSVFIENDAIQVYCDQTTDGGGWTVFQRRQDGSVDFYLGWEKYRNGFGDPQGEFWLGNEKLYRLLSVKSRYELRVDLADFDSNTAYAKYSLFMVGPENDNYVLSAEGYSGDAGDSLAYHNGRQFSTKDRDNDRDNDRNLGSCSQTWKGAWWYNNCHYSNLNGPYSTDKHKSDAKTVSWFHWKSGYFPIKFSEMKFREHM